MKRSYIGVFAVIVLLAGTAAFGATYGTVKVTVIDAEGAAIPGATVEATSPVFIGTRTATTDSTGTALLTALVPGTYNVQVSLSGFRSVTLTPKVSQNETQEVVARLALANLAESITVTAETPLVDTSRATVADEVTLEEVESLPVSRDYRGYAQLVSGVNVVPNQGGRDVPVDPASKGGNNYRDRTAEGRTGGTGSRDNQYYLDGLIITDIASGVGSMSFNNEVILEQQVLTSGIPAEFAGGKGFVGNIVTKSGGNEFSGSVNYYMMSPDFYSEFKASDDRLHTSLEDKNDAAVTFGGPIMRDRAWFFLSGQVRENSDEVQLSTSASPSGGTQQYKNDRQNYFGKLTLKPSAATTIIGQYFADPQETSGSTDVNTPPSRYDVIESTPKTMWVTGQHLFGGTFLLDGRVGQMKWDYFQGAADPDLGPQNTVLYDNADGAVNNYERLLGGSATAFTQVQKRDQIDLGGTYFLNAGASHTIKAGLQLNKLQDMTESTFLNGMTFTSIANRYSGITWNDVYTRNISRTDKDYIFNKLRADTGSAAFHFADKNGDGTLTADEFNNLTFTSTAGNPNGELNYFRNLIVQSGANNVQQDYNVVYLQDDIVINDYAINIGARVEDLKYIASDGSTIVDMDPTVAPRLGVTWNVGGQGRQKLSAFFGRYFDPIRMDMAHFAGNVSGRVLDEQVWIGNDWYTYRTRGSRERRDAGFAPNIESPYQDEYSVTYGANVSPLIGFTAQVYRRTDHNLVEDYDPSVYFDGAAGDLSLTPADFGYGPEGPGNVNYFLANLIGGERETIGVDLGVERRYANNWRGSVQYSWKQGKGNTSSDANADLQGDLLEVDPRQPYMSGRLPGTIPHQIKLFGSYRTPLNIEVGALYYWSSGAYFTEGDRAYGIVIPHDLTPNDSRDFNFTEIGAEQHPSFSILDLKFAYNVGLVRGTGLDLFLDVYNVFNNQDALYQEIVHNDLTFPNFGETRTILDPRRFQVGARLTF